MARPLLKLKKHMITDQDAFEVMVSENPMPDEVETGRDRKFHYCGNCFVLARGRKMGWGVAIIILPFVFCLAMIFVDDDHHFE